MTPRVLQIVPYKPSLHPDIRCQSLGMAAGAMVSNPDLSMALYADGFAEPGQPGDCRPWSRVARVRNRILDTLNFDQWDYLFWVDADVVQYDGDLPSKLIASNPTGISAPMIYVEDSPGQFYDWAAFVIQGRDHLQLDNRQWIPGRNLTPFQPYWDIHEPLPTTESVPMDCVGTITMVPTTIYKAGARYADHPTFTDHHPICLTARNMGLPVTINRAVSVLHANLPKYGEAWH